MSQYANQIGSALSDECWELMLGPELCGKFLSELPHCRIRILNSEISCTFKAESPQVIINNSCLCLPESGLNIEFQNVNCALLKKDPYSSENLSLVLTSGDRKEQITIEVPRSENKAIDLLTKKLIRTHEYLPNSGKIKSSRPALCPCCSKKRENVRTDITSHPIYHILSFACFVDQQIWIDFNRSMLSCSRNFAPSKECHPEGIISMASSEAIISMDLGEIFNSIAYLNNFEGTESTIVHCYNSHGHKLLSIIQQNTELFDVWSLISEREQE
ncbi:MAG: hypothetical protein CMO73_08670 [Verrucomicrobiales bacterium]|nr:hypothetical protein [Verrucomicrobiales bacterium]